MSKFPADYYDNVAGEVKDENKYIYDTSKIPNHVIKELTSFFLSDIIAFYESEEGTEKYENWKKDNK